MFLLPVVAAVHVCFLLLNSLVLCHFMHRWTAAFSFLLHSAFWICFDFQKAAAISNCVHISLLISCNYFRLTIDSSSSPVGCGEINARRNVEVSFAFQHHLLYQLLLFLENFQILIMCLEKALLNPVLHVSSLLVGGPQ